MAAPDFNDIEWYEKKIEKIEKSENITWAKKEAKKVEKQLAECQKAIAEAMAFINSLKVPDPLELLDKMIATATTELKKKAETKAKQVVLSTRLAKWINDHKDQI